MHRVEQRHSNEDLNLEHCTTLRICANSLHCTRYVNSILQNVLTSTERIRKALREILNACGVT